MPCSDRRYGDSEREANAYQAMELLCELGKISGSLNPDAIPAPLRNRLNDWWLDHHSLDSRFPDSTRSHSSKAHQGPQQPPESTIPPPPDSPKE